MKSRNRKMGVFAVSSVLSAMLNAQEITNGDGKIILTETNAPTVTIDTAEGSANGNFSWSNPFVPPSPPLTTGSVAWTSNDDTLSATTTVNNNGDIPMTQLHLYFNDEASSQILIQNGTNSTTKDKVVVKGGSQATSIALDFGGKGLSLSTDSNAKGTLYLNFGATTKTGKTLSITNLTTLNGNLSILGGGGDNSFAVNAETINGDVVFSSGNLDDSQGKSSITITKALNGNISTTTSMGRKGTQETGDSNGLASANNGIKINFNNGATMTGDIKGYGVGYDSLKRLITFNGGSGKTVLAGNVFSYGTNSKTEIKFDKTAGNHISFNQGNMQGSIIATHGNGMAAEKGYNNITFNSGDTQTLIGGILADDDNGQNSDTIQATNTLNVGQNTTLKIVADTNTDKNTVTDKDSANALPSNQYGTEDKTFTLTTGSIVSKTNGINEVNLGESATLILNNGEGEIKTEYGATNFNNQIRSKITFQGSNGTIQGKITSQGGGSSITVNNSASGTITGSITRGGDSNNTQSNNIQNTITLGTSANLVTNTAREGEAIEPAPEPIPATASLTLQGETNTITTLTSNANSSTLSIDGSKNANTTTIATTTINTDSNLTLNLNGRGASNSATLTIQNSTNGLTLKAFTLGNGSTNNTLDLSSRNNTTTITDKISVDNGQDLTIKLKDKELSLTNGWDSLGISTLSTADTGSSGTATLSGGSVTLTNLDLISSSNSTNVKLTLKNANTNVGTIRLNPNGETGTGTKTLTLDASSASAPISAMIRAISGEDLILELNGGNSGNTATFTLTGGNNTIKTLNVSGTTGNIFNVSGGSTTITDTLSIGNNKSLDINIGNATLTLSGDLTAGDTSNNGVANINFTGNGVLNASLKTKDTSSTSTINVGVGNRVDATINGTLTLNASSLPQPPVAQATTSPSINISFSGSDSSLSINGGSNTISTLTASGTGNTINLSGQARNSGILPSKTDFQTLTISDLKGDSQSINFVVSANPDANNTSNIHSDRVIIEGSTTSTTGGDDGASNDGVNPSLKNTTSPKVHYLGVVGDPNKIIGREDLYTIGGANNIALATVKNDINITLEATNSIAGFSLVTYSYETAQTNKDGATGDSGNDYTTYFLGKAISNGATEASQEVSAAALGTNYDLYLANMNSLNKRMGELRENPHSQGVWARVFNGMQTSTFALETQAIYTTIQAGYDYAFGFEGGNNYLGVVLSYANSSTTSKTLSEIDNTTQTQIQRGIDKVTSNAVEVALYNAYVQDGASSKNGWSNGLFSDSILKFSYITSSLTLLGQENTYSTSNFALTLSQEVGYRFLFGGNNEWSIDPQAEVAFGYLNQSNLMQTLSETNYLDGIQNAIVTLRSRFGTSVGYDFKNFTQDKGFNAKLYVGAYYVYDYIVGGDVNLTDNFGVDVSLSPLASTGRAVMNVGTNMSIKDNTRLYFDFEKSFGGKITTDYQVNFGVRYSFGESNGYTPMIEKAEFKAPLKVEEDKKEEDKTTKEEESTQEENK